MANSTVQIKSAGDVLTHSDINDIVHSVNSKVDAINGKGLSTNDYTNTEKSQLASLVSGGTGSSETTSSIKQKLGITTLSGSNTGDQDLTPYLLASTAANTYATPSSVITATSSLLSNSTDTFTSIPLVKYIVSLTQAEYDAISSKNTNTLYIIV